MKKREPWSPVPHTDRESYAVKAWAQGTASEAQQRLAFDWVMRATGLRNETFIEGKADATLYLQGRRSVGLNIVEAMNAKPKGEPPIG